MQSAAVLLTVGAAAAGNGRGVSAQRGAHRLPGDGVPRAHARKGDAGPVRFGSNYVPALWNEVLDGQ